MPAPHHSVFLQARCPSCRPTNNVKALKAINLLKNEIMKYCLSMIWMIYCNNCPDPTSKHASPKYDFLPDAISLLVFRLPMPVCHIVLTTNRTLYLTTKVMKKIQKLIVPEGLTSDTVTLQSNLICLLPFFTSGKKSVFAWVCVLFVNRITQKLLCEFLSLLGRDGVLVQETRNRF